MGSKISALTSAANLLGSTKKLALANAGFVVPDGWTSAVAVPLTGSTSETALATIAIPARAMGANGVLRVTQLVSTVNNANAKTVRIRLGGISGAEFFAASIASTITMRNQIQIQNRNSQSSQVAHAISTLNCFQATAAVPCTQAVDTSVALNLVITGQLGNAADTITLESYTVEILYKA